MSAVEDAVDRAVRKLDHARDLAGRFPGISAGQAYGAMLAAAEAHLIAKGLKAPRSHHSVQTALNKLYHDEGATTNPAKDLSRAYAWKEDEDYRSGSLIDADEIAQALETAVSFIERVLSDVGIDLSAHRERDEPSVAELQWLRDRGGLGR